MTEVQIVTLHVPDEPPLDAPLVFLGGVPVPASGCRLEVVQPEPPGFGQVQRFVARQQAVLELRAEPGHLANEALVEITKKPAKPHSSPSLGYVDANRGGSSVELSIDGVGPGEVQLYADNGDRDVVFFTLHADEVLTFAAELVALASRSRREHEAR